MHSWLRRSTRFAGTAFFRGNWPLRMENFEHLQAHGIQAEQGEAGEGTIWQLHLRHPAWGEATLLCMRDLPLPPHDLVDFDTQLTPEEAQAIKSSQTSVQLVSEGKCENILRDRKSALHYMNAILGDEGVGCVDHVSQKFWAREAIALETEVNADVDVEAIYNLHLVTDEQDRAVWLHSHGLAEIGFFDFDILRPAEDLLDNARDLIRAIGFAILEGRLKPGSDFKPLGNRPPVWAVPAAEFMAKGNPADTALRDDPSGEHLKDRVVLCDTKSSGLRSLFSSKPRPSALLSAEFPEGSLMQFSKEACELMAARAQATLPSLVSYAAELEEFHAQPLVKIAYGVDGGGEDDHEHLWFEFHRMHDGQIDATLLNEPFQIQRMKAGQRGLHSPAALSDWVIMTPVGQVTPRSTRTLRLIREKKEDLRAAMKEELREGA